SLPDIRILRLEAETFQPPLRGTVLYPKVQLIPIGYSQVGGRIDGVPSVRSPSAYAEPRETILAERVAEIVGHAAANCLFISVSERHLLHIGIVWLGAERREDFGLIAGTRAGDEQCPTLIRHLRLGRGLIGREGASG